MTNILFLTWALASAMPTDARARYEEEDRRLGALYKKVVAQLKEQNPAAVASLRASERKWIEFRDLECGFQDAALATAGIPAVACLSELTLQRIKTLEKVSETLSVEAAPGDAVITFSAAPWDGAAYELRIPLEKTKDAPEPALRIELWGNPEFSAPERFEFTGREDAGGGAGKGRGRASYQPELDGSLPRPLSGALVIDGLKHGRAVSGTYDLKTGDGARFQGSFRASWGNKAPGGRGGR